MSCGILFCRLNTYRVKTYFLLSISISIQLIVPLFLYNEYVLFAPQYRKTKFLYYYCLIHFIFRAKHTKALKSICLKQKSKVEALYRSGKGNHGAEESYFQIPVVSVQNRTKLTFGRRQNRKWLEERWKRKGTLSLTFFAFLSFTLRYQKTPKYLSITTSL